jgi:iron complex outermembrane receptor protein
LSVEAQLQSVGKQYLEDANTLSESAYFYSNLKISKSLDIFKDSALSLYVGVNNMTNSHYASMVIVNAKAFGSDEPRYYYPSLPRHLYLGVVWEL